MSASNRFATVLAVATLSVFGPASGAGLSDQGVPIELAARGGDVAVIAADVDRAVAVGLDEAEVWAGSRWTVLRSTTRAVDLDTALTEVIDTGVAPYASPVFTTPAGDLIIVAPELFVAFEPGTNADVIAAVLAAGPAIILDTDHRGMPGVVRARADVTDGRAVLAMAEALGEHPKVRFAEPNLVMTATLVGEAPDDEHFFRQWALNATGQNITEGVPGAPEIIALPGFDMDALEAWNVSTGDPSITVVVFDQGIQLDHPDLVVSFGEDFTDEVVLEPGGPVFECDRHGTAVAGTVNATRDNAIGVAGLCPDCSMASARIFNPLPPDPPCSSSVFVETQWILDALAWSVEIGARVTNHSYTLGAPSDVLDEMFAMTRAGGMVHFAAAGNGSSPSIGYPSSSPFVSSAAALEPINGGLAGFSNYGEGLSFSAPGEVVVTTDITGDGGYNGGFGFPSFDDYTASNGTSFASPYCAAAAALLLSAHPELSAAQVETILERTAVDLGDEGYDLVYGWGFVNAGNALHADIECTLSDLDASGSVDGADLGKLLASWGPCVGCDGDLDGDGTIDGADLGLLLDAWGSCGD